MHSSAKKEFMDYVHYKNVFYMTKNRMLTSFIVFEICLFLSHGGKLVKLSLNLVHLLMPENLQFTVSHQVCQEILD